MSKSDTQSVASLFFPSLKIKDVATGPLKRFQYFKQSSNKISKCFDNSCRLQAKRVFISLSMQKK